MRAKHIWEWMQEDQAGEVAIEEVAKIVDSEPEGQDRRDKYRGEGREEEREQTKWERGV